MLLMGSQLAKSALCICWSNPSVSRGWFKQVIVRTGREMVARMVSVACEDTVQGKFCVGFLA
jgi:hypothetical protein